MGIFSLEKWYLDATDDHGQVSLAHWARLRLGPIALTYAALLHASPTHAPIIRTSLASALPPTREPTRTTWMHDPLALRMAMNGRVLGAPDTLFQSDEGHVVWTPVHPDAVASVETPAFSLSGRGYAEHLSLTLTPWRLPIRILHWGRWIGANHSRVWIRWEGPAPLTRFIADGAPLTGDIQISETLVRHRAESLHLEPVQTLRDAPLDEVLAEHAPRLREAVSPAFLRTHETRWLSKGRLSKPDREDEVGWAVHERIQLFPEC